jgi:hypothetical protein
MHKRRGLQRLSRLLLGQFGGGQFPQLVVHQWEQLLGGVWITVLDLGKYLRNDGHSLDFPSGRP